MATAAAAKRLRMITFRVSDEEYESLKTLYPASGARSVSEFARSAIERLLAESGSGGQTIEARLDALESEVHRLARLLEDRP